VWWLRKTAVPLPAYRKGGFTDYVRAVYGSVIFGIAVQIDRAKRLGWMAHRKEKPALDAFLTRHLLADAIPNANADRESDQ